MQISVFQHIRCSTNIIITITDHNFCKVSNIHKYSSTTIVYNRNRKLNCKNNCVKNPVFYQIDKKITIASYSFFFSAKAEYCSS